MNSKRFFLGALLLLALATPGLADGDPSAIGLLRAQDLRLANIAERILIANAGLCRAKAPVTGFSVHTKDQYGPAAAGSLFANGEVAVASLSPRSPAAVVGMALNDGLRSINGADVRSLPAIEGSPLRDAVFEFLADLPPDRIMEIALRRDGEDHVLHVQPVAGCRALVEIRSESAIGARSDGRVIQVNYGLAAAASDEELAVVFAHELAHVVLEHRRRLSEAGVAKGFFGEFGRNQRLNRQVEVEADRMAAHLLANAGYDPAIAPAFFRSDLGKEAGRSLLTRSATYPSPEARAQLVEREIADYLPAPGPSWPGHLLARREVPFD